MPDAKSEPVESPTTPSVSLEKNIFGFPVSGWRSESARAWISDSGRAWPNRLTRPNSPANLLPPPWSNPMRTGCAFLGTRFATDGIPVVVAEARIQLRFPELTSTTHCGSGTAWQTLAPQRSGWFVHAGQPLFGRRGMPREHEDAGTGAIWRVASADAGHRAARLVSSYHRSNVRCSSGSGCLKPVRPWTCDEHLRPNQFNVVVEPAEAATLTGEQGVRLRGSWGHACSAACRARSSHRRCIALSANSD